MSDLPRPHAVHAWGLPTQRQAARRIVWDDQLGPLWHALRTVTERSQAETDSGLLVFGLGRSYGDSCLSTSGALLQLATAPGGIGMDRLIRLDTEHGILRAEAGITLAQILAHTLPRGWFLPVTPGTQHVTLGGALANDVHGKNHPARGSFGCWVRAFGLLRSDGRVYECTMHSTGKEGQLFAASLGGLGLTGILLWVEIQMMPVASAWVARRSLRFRSFEEYFALVETTAMVDEYAVAWLDGCSHSGRGWLHVGRHAAGCPGGKDAAAGLSLPPRRTRHAMSFPAWVFQPACLRVFNTLYDYSHHFSLARLAGRTCTTGHPPARWSGHGAHTAHTGSSAYHTVRYDDFLYPLDRRADTYRYYGRAGLRQYQCVLPRCEERAALAALWTELIRSKQPAVLAILKRFGAQASPGWLSFPMEGSTLALDFPRCSIHNPALDILFTHFDAIVRSVGGRIYPAKDDHISAADFRHMYPRWEDLEALRDPALCSRFWARVAR